MQVTSLFLPLGINQKHTHNILSLPFLLITLNPQCYTHCLLFMNPWDILTIRTKRMGASQNAKAQHCCNDTGQPSSHSESLCDEKVASRTDNVKRFCFSKPAPTAAEKLLKREAATEALDVKILLLSGAMLSHRLPEL